VLPLRPRTFLRPRLLLAALAVAVALPAPAARALVGLEMPAPIGPALSGAPMVSAGSDSALVSAQVVPGAAATSWSVQYGMTTGYGSATAAATLPAGLAPVGVSASLDGLVADATYHYRFVLTSAMATAYSPDATFATTSAVVTLSDPGLDPEGDPGTPGQTEAEGHQDAPTGAGVVTSPAPVTTTPAPTPAPARTSTPAGVRAGDTTVSARVTAATATRTAVRLTLRTTEPTTIRVTVRPTGGRARTKTYASVGAGTRSFTIPARLRTAATVTIVATDRAGNSIRITRRIRPLHGSSRRA
jgi:hypothetical protein